jgi:hypothetical protein
MMDCKHIDDLLVEYLYQELDPSQVERFEAHLQTCSRCTQELSAYERTRAVMQDLPEVDPPVRVLDFLSKEASRAVEPQSVSLWERVREGLRMMVLHPAMTAAVTLVLVLGVSFYIYQRSTPPTDRAEPDMPLTSEIDRPRPAGSRVIATAPIAPTPQEGTTATAEKQREQPSDNTLGAQGGANALGEDGTPRRPAKLVRLRTARGDVDKLNYTPGMRPTTVAKSPITRDAEKTPVARSGYGKGTNIANIAAGKSADLAAAEDEALAYNKKGMPPAKEIALRGKHRSEPRLAKAEVRPDPKLAPKLALKPAAPMATVNVPDSTDRPSKAGAAQAPRAKYKARPGKGGGGGKDDLDALIDGDDNKLASVGKGGRRKLGKMSPVAAQRQPQQERATQRKLAPAVARVDQQKQDAQKKQIAQQASSASYWVAQGDRAAASGQCSDALGFYNRAVEMQPAMIKSVAAKARSCAAVLAHGGEESLVKAQKAYPRLSGILAVQLEQTRRARQAVESKGGASGERVQQQQRASRKAAAQQQQQRKGATQVKAKAAPAPSVDAVK